MSSKICPLMAVANQRTELKYSKEAICLENDCAWWLRQKNHWECGFILLAQSLAAIGKLISDGVIVRRVTVKT